MTARPDDLREVLDAARDAYGAHARDPRSTASLARIFGAIETADGPGKQVPTRLPVCAHLAAAADPERFAGPLLRRLAEEHVPLAALPMNGTLEAIEHLRRQIPVAIASNSERPLLERLLEASGHAGLVDVVVSASDVAAPKPAPDVYLAATARLGVPAAATLVVEDSATGAAAALAAGCSVVHFAPEDAAAPIRQAVATVRTHHDLLLQLGLPPLADTEGKGRP